MLEDLIEFIESLLDPEQFGHAVTEEVRDEARKLLGIEPVLDDSTRITSKTIH
jgi:hypothetical protein